MDWVILMLRQRAGPNELFALKQGDSNRLTMSH